MHMDGEVDYSGANVAMQMGDNWKHQKPSDLSGFLSFQRNAKIVEYFHQENGLKTICELSWIFGSEIRSDTILTFL